MNRNDALCNVIAGFGVSLSFLCMVGMFFGANLLIGAIIGIMLSLFALYNYEP